MKNIAFQLLLVCRQHPNTTKRCANSTWKCITRGEHSEPERADGSRAFQFPIGPKNHRLGDHTKGNIRLPSGNDGGVA